MIPCPHRRKRCGQRKHQTTGSNDLFRARLDQIIKSSNRLLNGRHFYCHNKQRPSKLAGCTAGGISKRQSLAVPKSSLSFAEPVGKVNLHGSSLIGPELCCPRSGFLTPNPRPVAAGINSRCTLTSNAKTQRELTFPKMVQRTLVSSLKVRSSENSAVPDRYRTKRSAFRLRRLASYQLRSRHLALDHNALVAADHEGCFHAIEHAGLTWEI